MTRRQVLAPARQVFGNGLSGLPLRLGGLEIVRLFAHGHLLARAQERAAEVRGVVEAIDQEGLAEPGRIGTVAATERGAIGARGGDHQCVRIG